MNTEIDLEAELLCWTATNEYFDWWKMVKIRLSMSFRREENGQDPSEYILS